MLFFHLYKKSFFAFFCFVFPNIITYILNIANTIKKMPVNEISDFICGNYIQIGFFREKSYYSIKQQQQKKGLQLFATELTGKNT